MFLPGSFRAVSVLNKHTETQKRVLGLAAGVCVSCGRRGMCVRRYEWLGGLGKVEKTGMVVL